jgi:hypothetical protein
VNPQFFSVRQSSWLRAMFLTTAILTFHAAGAHSQDNSSASAASSLDDRLRALQQQLVQLQSAMNSMQDEIVRSRAESAELRREMEATRSLLAAQPKESGMHTPVATSVLGRSTQTPEETQQLTDAKLAELHQTKVESASKYRVRLSGIVLLNAVENRGAVDNLDLPSLAVPNFPGTPQGSFGATLRQSMLGLEVFGPQFGGARVSANVQFDFAGGFPDVPNGSAFGLARLRTGVVRLDWAATSIVAGQDALFFSPLSPSSVASLAIPEFSYSGNLWTWTPQIRVEHRIRLGESSKLLLQGGFLDPLSGEQSSSSYLRTPLAGEASRQPAYATRVAWTYRLFDHDLTLGAGAFYSRQNWQFGRSVDAWAGTTDWTIPLAHRWELSGEFYRGRGIGGLGGGLGRSVVSTGLLSDPTAQVQGLNAAGGWSQLKFRQTEKLEWNAGYGIDNSFAADLREYPMAAPGDYAAYLARNRSGFFNFIYRPRSDLLFSAEYRRLQTISITGKSYDADHINLAIGVLF